METQIEASHIENQNLKNVLTFEEDLRKTRDANEVEILDVACSAQADTMEWASGNLKVLQT